MQVFLSCVSSEFASYRLKLANQLGALQNRLATSRCRRTSSRAASTLLDQLADYIRSCDLVIHLVGQLSGARPARSTCAPCSQRLASRRRRRCPSTPTPSGSTIWPGASTVALLVYVAICRSSARLWLRCRSPRRGRMPCYSRSITPPLERTWRALCKPSPAHCRTGARASSTISACRTATRSTTCLTKRLGSLFKGREDFLSEAARDTGRRTSIAVTSGWRRLRPQPRQRPCMAWVASARRGRPSNMPIAIPRNTRRCCSCRPTRPPILQQNLAGLCGSMVLDLPEKDEREIETQVDGRRCAGCSSIPAGFSSLDNVDTEEAAPSGRGIVGRLSHAGQVLITSRLSQLDRAGRIALARCAGREDAADFYLLERTARAPASAA